MNKPKVAFYLLWLVLLAIGPITILRVTPFSFALGHPTTLTNFLQRIIGLLAFSLMFWQIMLGANMFRLVEKLGGWVFKFHVIEGIFIYVLVFLHPIFFMLFNYFTGHGLNPFYVFTDICVLCDRKIDLYYTLGRVSFWLINVTVLAGLFRAATPFMRLHWRKFHIFNYLVFLIVGIHGLLLGTDFSRMPFFAFAILAYLIVIWTIIRKLPLLFEYFKNWLTG